MPLRPKAVEGWAWCPGPVVRLVVAQNAGASSILREVRGAVPCQTADL